MTNETNEDEIIDTMLRNYQHLTPAERSEFQQRVVERAKAQRAEAIRGLFRALVDWFKRRAAIARLQRLDDHMLKDIGLTRGGIDGAVRGSDVPYRGQEPKSASVPSCGRTSTDVRGRPRIAA